MERIWRLLVWCLPSTGHGSGLTGTGGAADRRNSHYAKDEKTALFSAICGKGLTQREARPACCVVPILASPWPTLGIYRARTYKSHLVYSDHHHIFLTGSVASSSSHGIATRCKPVLTAPCKWSQSGLEDGIPPVWTTTPSSGNESFDGDSSLLFCKPRMPEHTVGPYSL